MLLRHNAMMIVPFSPAVTAMQKVLIVSFASWILHLVWTARSEEFTARLKNYGDGPRETIVKRAFSPDPPQLFQQAATCAPPYSPFSNSAPRPHDKSHNHRGAFYRIHGIKKFK